MDKFRRNIRDFLNYIKERLYDAIFEKFFFKRIFVLEEIPQFATNNQKTFANINGNEKNILMKGFEYISEYNEDFKDLKAEFIISYQGPANFNQFQLFIRGKRNGYYLKKAIEKFIFKVILVLLQLLILIYYYPKHFCVNKLIDDNSIDDDTMFWIYDNQKYEVKKDYNERLFYLRIMSFILDLILIISESIVLYNLKRIKAKLHYILFLQLIRYIVYALLIYYEYSEEICDKTSEKNIFYKKEEKFNFLELLIFIYAIIKFIIF